MADKPITANLPADLPENWQTNQIVSPSGTEVGLSEQHGYNYQSKQINDAQKAINAINGAFTGLAASNHTHTPASIGAAAANHTHTPASLGAAAANHTHTPASIGAVAVWTLIAQYKAAGSYTWTVPAGVTQIGVYMVGGGGSGAVSSRAEYGKPTGGASGYAKNLTLTVTPGQTFPLVVGAGGASVSIGYIGMTYLGNAGGTTSFNGATVGGGSGGDRDSSTEAYVPGASGGQGSRACTGTKTTLDLYGGADTGDHGGASQSPRVSQNMFDPYMVTLSAGGDCHGIILPMPDGTKGGSGAAGLAESVSIIAENATGNGNGGGAACNTGRSQPSGYTVQSGAGSPGMVLIYAKAV